jgi:hypothetical protein
MLLAKNVKMAKRRDIQDIPIILASRVFLNSLLLVMLASIGNTI